MDDKTLNKLLAVATLISTAVGAYFTYLQIVQTRKQLDKPETPLAGYKTF